MPSLGRVVVPLAVASALAGGASGQEAGREPHTYLKKIGFSNQALAQLDAGKVVSRIISEKDDHEAFVMGVVRVAADPESFVDGIRKIETLRTTGRVLQIGRFSLPPSADDVQALALDPDDLDDLGKCRVGECDVQLPREVIERARALDWKSRDVKAQAAELMKDALVRQVTAYLQQGSSAMPVYAGHRVPDSVERESMAVLQNSPNLMGYNPEFLNYLIDFPRRTLPNLEDYVYWSKEKVRKPVVSLVHVCIQKLTRGSDMAYFIALMHIYDTHYFLANIEFLTVVPDPGDAARFYLLHAVRARLDPPQSFRGLLLGKIKGAIKDTMEADLLRTKLRLEARARALSR